MNSSEFTHGVFLSYARRDQELAAEIKKVLDEKGLRSWSGQQLEAGKQWEEEVSHALKNCDSMIAILNPNSFSSSRVRDELEYAFFNEKYKNRLLPVLIGGQKEDDFTRLPWILNELQFFKQSQQESLHQKAQQIVDAFIDLLKKSGETR